jgi:hypothetical protein
MIALGLMAAIYIFGNLIVHEFTYMAGKRIERDDYIVVVNNDISVGDIVVLKGDDTRHECYVLYLSKNREWATIRVWTNNGFQKYETRSTDLIKIRAWTPNQ